jgi:hypothetical protein
MTDSAKETLAAFTHTYLSGVEVPRASTITGKFHTPSGWSPGGEGNTCRIGVWKGSTIPNAPRGPASSNAPIISADTVGEDGSFQLEAQGTDFRTGLYTIAYYVIGAGPNHSICATLTLSDGRPIKAEHTSLSITRQEISDGKFYLTVSYSSPTENIPVFQSDAIIVCAGETVSVPGTGQNIGFTVVGEDPPTAGQDTASGSVKISLSAPTANARYIVEYNPGNKQWPVSAYRVFTWTL